MFLRPVDDLDMRWVASVIVWCSVIGQIVVAIPEAVSTGRITWVAQGDNTNAHVMSMVGIPLVLLTLLWIIRRVPDDKGRTYMWWGVVVTPGVVSIVNIISNDVGTGSYAHYFFVGTLSALFFTKWAASAYMVWVALCAFAHSMVEPLFHIALSRWIAFMVVYVGGIAALMFARETQSRTAAALRDRSEIDALTGCFTRVRFLNDLAEVSEALGLTDTTQPALILFDVDYFKTINDRQGHIVGDLVLREMGAVLQDLPPPTRAYRLGGDEFAVIAHSGDLQSANSLADAVVASFSERSIAVAPDASQSVTSSYGATLIHRQASPWGLYAEADQVLYEAKSRRRRNARTTVREEGSDVR